MNKNEFPVHVAVIFLTVAFAAISLAVFLSKGKSAYLISKKMKTGALLLSLTAAVTTQSCLFRMCYSTSGSPPVAIPGTYFGMDDIKPDANGFGVINVDLNVDNKISGSIYDRQEAEFSFNIADTTSHVVQSGNIHALDGSFDSDTEEFVITINDTLKTGNYFLNLYPSDVSNQGDFPMDFFRLRIVNED